MGKSQRTITKPFEKSFFTTDLEFTKQLLADIYTGFCYLKVIAPFHVLYSKLSFFSHTNALMLVNMIEAYIFTTVSLYMAGIMLTAAASDCEITRDRSHLVCD